MKEERNRLRVKIPLPNSLISFLPANLTLFNEKGELKRCFDDLSTSFSTEVNMVEAAGPLLLCNQEKAPGPNMNNEPSPPVSQQAMPYRKR